MWPRREISFIFVILTVLKTCEGEVLRPYLYPHPHRPPPTTQPTKYTLDRPPLAIPPLPPVYSSTQALSHRKRVARRVSEGERNAHTNTYNHDYIHTLTTPIRRPRNSRGVRPPLGEGPWRVSRPLLRPRPTPPPPPYQHSPPRLDLPTPPTHSRNSLRKPLLLYLKGFLGVTERGTRGSGKACVGEGGRRGVCMLKEECVMEGGTPSLPCEEGYYHFATCCVAIVRGCEGQAVNNMTYWIQPVQFSGGTTCRLLVPKLSQEICFIRLDLRTFQLASPSDGRCDRDYLQVSGQNINAKVPTLCGFNSGQHLYVGVGRVPGPLELAVTTRGEEPRRRWEIEVTQVECGGERAPPDGCLQYYTSPQGFFASFNYLPTGASQYLNNLNYAVCLARATAFCSVTYSAGSKTADNTFQMVNFSVRNGTLIPTVAAGEAGVGVVACRGDYVVMAGTRLCGGRLNDGSQEPRISNNGPVIESTNGPFLVQVRTDAQYTGRGFNLSYAQNPC